IVLGAAPAVADGEEIEALEAFGGGVVDQLAEEAAIDAAGDVFPPLAEGAESPRAGLLGEDGAFESDVNALAGLSRLGGGDFGPEVGMLDIVVAPGGGLTSDAVQEVEARETADDRPRQVRALTGAERRRQEAARLVPGEPGVVEVDCL